MLPTIRFFWSQHQNRAARGWFRNSLQESTDDPTEHLDAIVEHKLRPFAYILQRAMATRAEPPVPAQCFHPYMGSRVRRTETSPIYVNRFD